MTIHPNTPPQLVKAYRKHRSYHKTADALDVNVSYVHDLITKGIEPNDTTPTLRTIRNRLFLPKYRRRAASKPRQPKPEHRRWWQSIGPDGRELIIKQMHDLNKDRLP